MTYRKMGEEAYFAFCKVQLLHDTSVKKPVTRKFRLRTFTKEKVRAKKVSDLEKRKTLDYTVIQTNISFFSRAADTSPKTLPVH